MQVALFPPFLLFLCMNTSTLIELDIVRKSMDAGHEYYQRQHYSSFTDHIYSQTNSSYYQLFNLFSAQCIERLGKINRRKKIELCMPSNPTLIGFALWRWIIFAFQTRVTHIMRYTPAKKAAFGAYIKCVGSQIIG